MHWLILLLIIVGIFLYINDKNTINDSKNSVNIDKTTQIGRGWPNPCLEEIGADGLIRQIGQVGPVNVGKNADSYFFSPPDITGSCQRYGSPYPDRSSLIAISNNNGDCSSPKVSNLNKLIHPGAVDQTYYYDNPCLTRPPYGTKTAGLEYMMKLPELNDELYKNCDQYGCPSSDLFTSTPDSSANTTDKTCPSLSTKVKSCEPLPALAKTCAFTNGSVSPSLIGTGQAFGGDAAVTLARNDITEEMYHNPTAFCSKNPNHPRCALFSGLFTPFIGPVVYKNGFNEVVGDGLIPMDKVSTIPRPTQSNIDGFCLETDPYCMIDDTRGVTILQSQMMDPRC